MFDEGVRVGMIHRSSGPGKMKLAASRRTGPIRSGVCLGQIFPRRHCVAAGDQGNAASPRPPDQDHCWAWQVARTTQPDAMSHTESTLTECPINLVGTNNGRITSMTPATSRHLTLQIFRFVIEA